MAALQQALDQANEVGEHLDLAADDIGAHAAELGKRLPEDRIEYEVAHLRALLLDAADCHSDVCAGDDTCCLCKHLRPGLALITALLNAELTEAMEHRLTYDPARRPKLIERPGNDKGVD